MTNQQHPFDDATKLRKEGNIFIGKTSPKYANMVGPFGGIIAATLLRAALEHPKREGEPVALTVNYAAPISDGEFKIHVSPARTNRSTQHWTIELTQEEKTVITATALFAKRQKTWTSTEAQMPEVASADLIPSLPAEGLPDWVQNYDMRIVQGFPDLTNPDAEEAKTSITKQWVKDQPERPLDFLSLASMSDSFFPRVFIRRNKMVPAGTVSLTIYFHADAECLASYEAKPILGKAWANRFYDGFFDQSAEMWSEDGKLLATTNQIVYYRDE